MDSDIDIDSTFDSTISFLATTTFNNTIVHPPDVYQYELWQKIILAMFMFPIIFLSIAGNIIVVIAICRYPYLRVTNNTFLASLAVADCAVGILAMPPNALQLLSGHWYLKSFMCRFWFTCDVLFSTASIMHLCCVSIDRYLSISDAYTFSYLNEDPTKSWRVRVMIASVWIVSSLLSFVCIFTDMFTTDEHAAIIDSLEYENGQCAFIVNIPYRFVSSCVSFWIPAAVMIFFYGLVMKKAYNLENGEFKKYRNIGSNRSDRRTSVRQMSDSMIMVNNIINVKVNRTDSEQPVGGDVLHRNSQDMARNWRREYRLIKTLGIVMAVFILCWIFFFLRYTLCGLTESVCPTWIAKSLVLEDILFWIGYFNSAINPFLYNYTNRDFRRAFRDLLKMNKKNKNHRDSYTDKAECSLSYFCCCCCCEDKRNGRLQSLTPSQQPTSRKTTIEEAKNLMK